MWRRRCDFEISRAGNGLVREIVQHFDFERVVTRRKGCERQAAIQSDLFAFTRDGSGIFRRTPDLLFVAQQAIGSGDACLSEDFVGFQIVELQKDSEIFRIGKRVREARSNFVWSKYKL